MESKIREEISVEVDYDGGSYEADIVKMHGKFNYLNVYIYLFCIFSQNVKVCYSLFPLLTIRLCILPFFATNVELQKRFAAGQQQFYNSEILLYVDDAQIRKRSPLSEYEPNNPYDVVAVAVINNLLRPHRGPTEVSPRFNRGLTSVSPQSHRGLTAV